MHGVIPVLKPKGMTSYQVVSQMRRLSKQKKVGHTGTLDPEAEGVLPICFGQATRIAEYIQSEPKRYHASMKIGVSTDTEDHTGTIIAQQENVHLSEQRIEEVFHKFTGTITQIPPMYSAVKFKGQRLYSLAREGKTVERSPRKVRIDHLDWIGWEEKHPHPILQFDVICSKGTYVRTLCVDIGKELGYPAHMTSLLRTESGSFHLEDCYTLSQLTEMEEKGELSKALYSLDEVLGRYPSLIVSQEEVRQVYDGWFLYLEDELTLSQPLVRVYTDEPKFCALYRWYGQGILKPEKVFRDVES